MEYSFAALDGEVKMPAGEEQVVTADTLQSTLTQYQSDVMTNLQNILGNGELVISVPCSVHLHQIH